MLSGSSFEVEEYWMSSDNFSKFFVAACFFVGCFSAFLLFFFFLLVLKMTVLYYSNTFFWKDENYKPFSPYPYRLKYFLYKKSIWTNRPALYYTTPRTSLKIKTFKVLSNPNHSRILWFSICEKQQMQNQWEMDLCRYDQIMIIT